MSVCFLCISRAKVDFSLCYVSLSSIAHTFYKILVSYSLLKSSLENVLLGISWTSTSCSRSCCNSPSTSSLSCTWPCFPSLSKSKSASMHYVVWSSLLMRLFFSSRGAIDLDAKFEPSLLNTAIYLLGLSQQVSTFAINFQVSRVSLSLFLSPWVELRLNILMGFLFFRDDLSVRVSLRTLPFTGVSWVWSLWLTLDRRISSLRWTDGFSLLRWPLRFVFFGCWSAFLTYTLTASFLFLFLFFGHTQFKVTLTSIMIADFAGCFIIEKVCKALFADLAPKELVTRGRERREKRRAEEERLAEEQKNLLESKKEV